MPPKKNKKDKAKEKEEAEKRAREEEEARLIREEKEAEERKKMEKIRMKDRKKMETMERKVRATELSEISSIITEQNNNFRRVARENCKNAKWERYMRCDGTPDPSNQGVINTYINLQSKFNEEDDIHTVMKKAELDLTLIKELKDLIDMDIEDDDELKEKDIKRFSETIVNLDELLQFKLNSVSYLELCDASKHADPETSNLQLVGKNNDITLCIWGNLGKNLRIKSYEFKELGFTFEIPKILALTNCAFRLLHTKYDYHSQKSRSFQIRKKVQKVTEQVVLEEVKKEEQEEEGKKEEGEEKEVQEEKEELANTKDLLAGLQGNLIDGLLEGEGEESKKKDEEDEEEEVKEFPFPPSPEPLDCEDFDEPDDVIDLRSNAVIGGIYHFDLLHLPSQPNVCKKWTITEVTYPPRLKYMDYVADPLECPLEKKKEETKEETKEESEKQEPKHEKEEKGGEEEGKKEEEEKKEKEVKKEKGKDAKKEKDAQVDTKRDEKPPIGIILKIPATSVFSENPLPAMWDERQNAWVMKNFSDIKYAEETKILQFKMHSFGTFALIQDHYINMPFQSWELRPRDTNQAILTITAAVLELEFEIKDGLCSINLPGNTGATELRDKWMKPEKLIKHLQWSGINVFPAIDAPKYVSIQDKSAILEDHVYQQISLVASAMGFSWSRWNGEATRDVIVVQAQECLLDEPLQEDLHTYMVNKTHVIKLKLSEFDDDFNLEPMDTTDYYSNFYHLMKRTASDEARSRIENSSPEFRNCLKKLLSATKILTYS